MCISLNIEESIANVNNISTSLYLKICRLNRSKVGPYIHSAGLKKLTFPITVKEQNYDETFMNKTVTEYADKGEAWIFGECNGNCPSNCTDRFGGVVPWWYYQKAVSPTRDDIREQDTSLKIFCKGKSS